MLNNEHDTRAAACKIDDHGQLRCFTHPDEVLHDGSLGADRKREILAGWASDAHAMFNLPTMRQLESGGIVSVDAVLTALQALDAQTPVVQSKPIGTRSWSKKRFRFFPYRVRRNNDDDDPPPCPAAALPPGIELELRRRRDAEWKFAPAA